MKNRSKEQAGTRKRERGSILATSAIGMLSILLAVGLGVDISRFYLTKTELQNAADAAALAGVSGLNGSAAGYYESNRSRGAGNEQLRLQQDGRDFSPRERLVCSQPRWSIHERRLGRRVSCQAFASSR